LGDLLRDDGCVIYINGTEAVRSNMLGGTITYDSLSSTTVSGADETTYYEYALEPWKPPADWPTGDPACRKTLEVLWRDMVSSKMYITGGVGSRAAGEAFGEPYELPNAQAYTESCAAIGNMLWNWRLLAATADARHADLIERALYNGINSGMSLDGTLYCYRNPLELGLEKVRNPWYDTTCCPPNLQRILASLPGYLYSTSPDGVYVHLYHSSTMDWNGLRLEQKTRYPWEGAVEISATPAKAADFTVFLRIPAFSSAAKVTVNGKPWQGPIRAGEYLALRRSWRPGDRILLRCGDTWNEELHPKGNGTPEKPILVGSYGKGKKPVIDREDYNKDLVGIHLVDQEGFKIVGLEFNRCMTGVYGEYSAGCPTKRGL
jgi:hypothetical protein